MDEVQRLEREIRNLQTELHKQTDLANQARQQLIADNRRALESYRKEMNTSLDRHDQATQREYDRLLEQYKRSVDQELQTAGANMEVGYQMLLANTKKNQAMLETKNRELESLMQSLKADIGRKEQGNAKEAEKFLSEAASTYTVVNKKPHEKFMPNRLRILANVIEESKQLFSAGLFEAATAVAISARSGIERLDISLDESIREWERYYDLFEENIDYLAEKFKDGLTTWCDHIGANKSPKKEEKRTRLIEINYWSKGVFEQLFSEFLIMQRIRVQISSMGKQAYLSQPGGENVESLKEKIKKVEDISRKIDNCSMYLVNAYDASCERSDWGEKIIKFLADELNLVWLEDRSGFRVVQEEDKKKRDFMEYIIDHYKDESIQQDTREWMELAFETANGTVVFVYVVPIENKNQVTNQVVMHIEYYGPEQGDYSKDMFLHICESIGVDEINSGVVNYAADINQLKISSNKAFRETAVSLEKKMQMTCQ